MRLSAGWAPLLMAVFMSLFMVIVITGTLNLMSGHPSLTNWLYNFLRVWPIAFAATLAILPMARRLVAGLTRPAE